MPMNEAAAPTARARARARRRTAAGTAALVGFSAAVFGATPGQQLPTVVETRAATSALGEDPAAPSTHTAELPSGRESASGSHADPAATTAAQPASYETPISPVGNPDDGVGRSQDEAADAGSVQVSRLTASGVPEAALGAYRSAAERLRRSDPGCGLDWSLLAGIGRVESDHGRFGGAQLGSDGIARPEIRGIPLDGRPGVARILDTEGGRLDGDTVYDRAVGPMQFIPGTWALVGADGDLDGQANPHDIDDAALAAALYLCAGTGPLSNEPGARAALFRYNRSEEYGSLVLAISDAYRSGTPVARLGAVPPAGADDVSPPPVDDLPPAAVTDVRTAPTLAAARASSGGGASTTPVVSGAGGVSVGNTPSGAGAPAKAEPSAANADEAPPPADSVDPATDTAPEHPPPASAPYEEDADPATDPGPEDGTAEPSPDNAAPVVPIVPAKPAAPAQPAAPAVPAGDDGTDPAGEPPAGVDPAEPATPQPRDDAECTDPPSEDGTAPPAEGAVPTCEPDRSCEDPAQDGSTPPGDGADGVDDADPSEAPTDGGSSSGQPAGDEESPAGTAADPEAEPDASNDPAAECDPPPDCDDPKDGDGEGTEPSRRTAGEPRREPGRDPDGCP
jgi:membrane-bound lytic murein transglycosylase B